MAASLSGKSLVQQLPLLWLALFFALPFCFVIKISLSEPALAQPPFLDWLRTTADGSWALHIDTSHYRYLLQDPLYLRSLLASIKVAAISTVLCLLLGYPMAYAIARSHEQWRLPLLMMVVLPFWTSFLIRVYAWMGILKNNGLLNQLLMSMGLIDQPLDILFTPTAVYIGIVYSYLPFLVLPLYATLVRLDPVLLEAAADLGCRPFKQFLTITLPLSMPGVIAGSLLVFIPVMGEFVIPDLLGGPDSILVGRILWMEFFNNKAWPMASALAALLLFVLIIPFVVLRHYEQAQEQQEREAGVSA